MKTQLFIVPPLSAILLVAASLILMPGTPLSGQIKPADEESGHPQESGISLKQVNSIVVDHENRKWFCTGSGIVSYDGDAWILHKDISSVPVQNLRSLTYIPDPDQPELWIASSDGATVTRFPVDEQTVAITYNTENASLTSQSVRGIAAGEDKIRWIGTDKGVAALNGDRWLNPDYASIYTERMFTEYPITSMATNLKGDSLFMGTEGIGVIRVYRDKLDGISGASVYAQWGPIDLPSDYILSIFIAPDGTKWFGTEEGAARHRGNNTLDNWTAFTTDDGLVDNFVQVISGDHQGNIWFGTPAGISVYTGSSWTSYTTENGLVSNNILSLCTDKQGLVWIGTDKGINSFEKGKFITY